MFYRDCLFPILRRMDPESVHDRACVWLRLAQSTPAGRAALRWISGGTIHRPVELFGLTFPNLLGIAAGFDKDVKITPALACMGFGHVETGTLTPLPQPGNPKPRIFRLPPDEAIVNRMGFPNSGVEAAIARLTKIYNAPARKYVIGVSLGKQKTTELTEAAGDYIKVMRRVYPVADYMAINISSPNTPGLRELQGGQYLESLLRDVMCENRTLAGANGGRRRPMLVKIAPDVAFDELDAMLEAITGAGVDGIVATNTTLGRDGLIHPNQKETGGLSGRPVAELSTKIIAHIHKQTEGKLPIIGVGGVFDADSAKAKLDAGASLLQVYTGFIYQGPRMARRTLDAL